MGYRLVCGFLLLGLLAPSAFADASPRQIALTFDDAPREDGAFFSGKERTRRLIEALDKAAVSGAMFFVTTGNAERNDPDFERLRSYESAGHVLANHSHSHLWLHRTATDQYLDDLDHAQSLLESIGTPAAFYRYPFLDEGRAVEKRDAAVAALAERNLRNGYVTVDNYDWYMDALVQRAAKRGDGIDREVLREAYVGVLMEAVRFYDAIGIETIGRSPRHVLLLHENDLAALYIVDLVAALREEGWEIIPALDAYADPIAEEEPDTVFLGQGRVAALAHARGVRSAPDLVHEAEDEAWLEAYFQRLQVFTQGDPLQSPASEGQ